VRPIPVFEAGILPEVGANAGSGLASQPVEARIGAEQRQDKVKAGAHLRFELPGRIDHHQPRRRQLAVHAGAPDNVDPEYLVST